MSVEELLVGTADKVWKGKRVHDLEDLLVGRLALLRGTASASTGDTTRPSPSAIRPEAGTAAVRPGPPGAVCGPVSRWGRCWPGPWRG